MSFAKFQPSPTDQQAMLAENGRVQDAWGKWFKLIPPKLTSPAISGTPVTSADNGTQGQLAFDASFLYVCVQSTTPIQNALWKRIALTAF